jgi:hypothetical protein
MIMRPATNYFQKSYIILAKKQIPALEHPPYSADFIPVTFGVPKTKQK